MRSRWIAILFTAAAMLPVNWGRTAGACPICPAAGKTFSEEIASADVAVIARLRATPRQGKSGDMLLGEATFEVTEVIKGRERLAGNRLIVSTLRDEAPSDGRFLFTAVADDELLWSTPLPMTPRAIAYLKAALELPAEGTQRLNFFQKFFEDDDPLLAADACDEFSRLPYTSIKAHGPQMNRRRLLELVQSETTTDGHRRLYLTMLSACGKPDDARLLERFLLSDDADQRRGLDALVVCYLTLGGEQGMPLVEERFLENRQADYAETYAVIMAYRFLGTEQEKISRRRLLQGLRPILERPDLADLVIPDFANWEDWSVMDRLVELFKTSDEKTTWVRVPVINYLRQCPLPKAAKYLDELEKIDSDSLRRAKTFFPDVKGKQ